MAGRKDRISPILKSLGDATLDTIEGCVRETIKRRLAEGLEVDDCRIALRRLRNARALARKPSRKRMKP